MKKIEISYKGYPIYSGTIVEGEFVYSPPPESDISTEEWTRAWKNLLAKFTKMVFGH